MAEDELELHEEELRIDTRTYEAGAVRARKTVESRNFDDVVPRDVEDADVERVPSGPGDSGQVETLPDGSISIPLLEEELVVTKRLVVRERIIIRKRITTVQEHVHTELRTEQVQLETEGDAEVEVE